MQLPKEIFKKLLPFWDNIEESDRHIICENTVPRSFSAGENIHSGGECSGVIFVRTGCLRVYILSENGKDITLYRLFPGDMCMLSASCVLESITFDVTIDAEENSECIIIGGAVFNTLSQKYKDIRIFSLETAVSRFSDVMWIMQQILFMSMDKRLAVFLIDEAAGRNLDLALSLGDSLRELEHSAALLDCITAEGDDVVKGGSAADRTGAGESANRPDGSGTRKGDDVAGDSSAGESRDPS